MTKKKQKPKLRPYRRTFYFNFGTGKTTRLKVAVKAAIQEVIVELAAEDVHAAIKADGVGNSMLCAGSQCMRRWASAFPHPVFPPVDWLDTIVFIPDKVKDGLPISCVAYTHKGDDTAKLFDAANPNGKDKNRGARKLAKQLEKTGPITIRLLPWRRTKSHPPPEGFVRRYDGTRSGQLHDVVVIDGAEEAIAQDKRASGLDLPRPTAIAEPRDGMPYDPGRGAMHRFARAYHGVTRGKQR